MYILIPVLKASLTCNWTVKYRSNPETDGWVEVRSIYSAYVQSLVGIRLAHFDKVYKNEEFIQENHFEVESVMKQISFV